MLIKKIDPIKEESIVRRCISKKNQENYLKKMKDGNIILYAGYEKDIIFGITGIEFDRIIKYINPQKKNRIKTCDYICAGYTFPEFRNKGISKLILYNILDKHLDKSREIGITLTGDKKEPFIPKDNLKPILINILKKGFKIKGYSPEHFGPFLTIKKGKYK